MAFSRLSGSLLPLCPQTPYQQDHAICMPAHTQFIILLWMQQRGKETDGTPSAKTDHETEAAAEMPLAPEGMDSSPLHA